MRRVLLQAATEFWLLVTAVIVLVAVVDDDRCLIFFLLSSQSILFLLFLDLLLLLYSMVACVRIYLLLHLVIANHESVVKILGLLRDVLVLHKGEFVRF